MSTLTTREQLQRQADELARTEILVETNDGTYGAVEACRKVGCGDPQFATRNVYETVGSGARRATGPDETRAPGRMRRINADTMAQQRRRLADLREQIRDAR